MSADSINFIKCSRVLSVSEKRAIFSFFYPDLFLFSNRLNQFRITLYKLLMLCSPKILKFNKSLLVALMNHLDRSAK